MSLQQRRTINVVVFSTLLNTFYTNNVDSVVFKPEHWHSHVTHTKWIIISIIMLLSFLTIPIPHLTSRVSHVATVNTLRPRQNGRHFADDIFKWIFLNENVWMPIKISLKFVPEGPINNISALVQIMAWRLPGDKPLSGAMMVRLPTHICVTRPQWVKSSTFSHFHCLAGLQWRHMSAMAHRITGNTFVKNSLFGLKKSKLRLSGSFWVDTYSIFWGHICMMKPTNTSNYCEDLNGLDYSTSGNQIKRCVSVAVKPSNFLSADREDTAIHCECKLCWYMSCEVGQAEFGEMRYICTHLYSRL